MIDLTDRTAVVRAGFDTLFDGIGIPVAVLSPQEWMELDRQPDEQHGFIWPRLVGDDVFVAYCPDVIAALGIDLTDEQFAAYLDIVEYMLALHVADAEAPFDERRTRIEDELRSLRPEAMDFLTQVQMDALDAVQEEL